jgi:hypothetical protein
MPGFAWSSEKSCTPAGRREMKRVEAEERASGSALAERREHRGHQLGQQLARAGAAHRAVAAVMPAADQGRIDRRGVRGSRAAPASRACRDRLDAGEDEIARRLRRGSALPRTDARSGPRRGAAWNEQRSENARPPRSREARERVRAPSSVSGSVCVCSSSTICSRCSTGAGSGRPRSVVAHGLRRCGRRRRAPSASQVRRAGAARVAAAPDELLGLGEELDLADAAAAELDVVAGDRDRRVPPRCAWIWRLIEWMSGSPRSRDACARRRGAARRGRRRRRRGRRRPGAP